MLDPNSAYSRADTAELGAKRMVVQENYAPRRINANGTLSLANATRLGGFICGVSGTLTLNIDGALVVSMPVTAGVFHPLPFSIGGVGASEIVLSGGAAGAAAVI